MTIQRIKGSLAGIHPLRLPFPVPHRGDPDRRRMALASIGSRWQGDMWRRGRVILTDADIDQMDPRRWAHCLRRWTRRRPRVRD